MLFVFRCFTSQDLDPETKKNSLEIDLVLEESMTPAEAPSYDPKALIKEIMDPSPDSPRIFVLNLPDAETTRDMCADPIRRTFKVRKESFTLDPRVLFVFDEAQEFIPQERKKEDRTEASSKAV